MKKSLFFLCFLVLMIEPSALAQSVNNGAPRFRLAVQGGYGYRLGKNVESGQSIVDEHNKRLKNGLTYGADLTWYTSGDIGFGLKFSNMHSKSEDMVTVTYDDGTMASGEYRDVVDMRFFGPIFSSRYVSPNNKWIFLINCGIGYLSYVDNGRVIDPMSIKSGTLGVCADAGIDLRLMNSLYLGVSAGMIGGSLSSYSVTENGQTQKIELDKDQYESVNHLSLTIGLRLYL